MLVADPVYSPTRILTENYLKEFNVRTVFYNPHDLKTLENNITKKPKTYGDLFLMNLKHKAKRGINASSIADISSIPRATVIRKLKTLEKRKLISRNKKLEYSLGVRREDMKIIERNYLVSQRAFSDYASTMFNLMKFSKFSI